MDEYVIESPAEEAQAPVDPRRAVLLPLWRGRYLVLATSLLGILAGALSGVISPNSYMSVGKLIFRAGAREELSFETSVTGGGGWNNVGGRNVVMDELHLLSAPQVYEEAARIVTPAEVFKTYDPSARDDKDTPGLQALFHRWQSWWFRNSGDSGELADHQLDTCDRCCRLAGLALARNLLPLAEQGSNVISVTYITHDPQLAQKVVAAFLDAAIAHHRKIYQTTPALEFLNGQMVESEKALKSADSDFMNFKTRCAVMDYESEQQTLTLEIRSLESQVAADRSRVEDLRASTAEWKALLVGEPATIEQRTEHSLQVNPRRTVLQQRIYTIQDELAALDRRTGGTSDELNRLRAGRTQELERANKDLLEQPEFVDAGPAVTTIANQRYVRLTQSLDDGKVELAALEAAATVRVKNLEELHERQLTIAGCGPEFESLQRKSSKAREDFEGFRKLRDGAKLMSSMDQIEMSNLRRIQDATLPNDKEGPRRGKLVFIGLLVGAVVGCALAFARNMLDHRLHDAVEVESLLRTSVLAVIPLYQPPMKGQLAPRSAAR